MREPFPSKTTGLHLVFGKIPADAPFEIESLMAGNGIIFGDGVESDWLAFNSGVEAAIGLADLRCPGFLVNGIGTRPAAFA